MNLEQLQKLGAFVSPEPVKKSVTWTRTVEDKEQSDTFDIYVRRQSFGDLDRLLTAEDDDRSTSAAILARSLLLGEEKTPITYQQAYQLEPSFAKVLVTAVKEVNGLGGAAKK